MIFANIVLAATVFTAVVGLLTRAIWTSRPQQLPAQMKARRIRQPHGRHQAAKRRRSRVQPQL